MQRGRPRSPDRWAGSPQGAGWDRDRSISRSRSRSRSPRGGAGGGRYMGGRGRGGGPGYRGQPNPRHNGTGGPPGNYGSKESHSDDSGSSSSSGDSAERGPRRGGGGGGRGSGAAGGRGAGGEGPAGGSRREGELLGRVSTLEAELASEREAHEADRKKLALVSEKVRAVAERSKNRGNMLVRLVTALRRVDGARAGVEAAQTELTRAQDDLSTIVLQATTMLEGEEAAHATKAEASALPQQAIAAAGPGPGQAVSVAGGPPPPPPGEPPAGPLASGYHAGPGPEARGADVGMEEAGTGGAGWSEAGVAAASADGRPKALSFKLKIPTNV